jgi:hypothetical protein
MTRRLLQLGVAGALILAVGGHWIVLQSVAWAGMVITYSQSAPLTVALQKTFDGAHPCKLCKVVEEGRHAEQQQATLKLEMKIDFFLERPAAFALLPCGEPSPAAPATIATQHLESPPTPPPLRG